MMATLLVAMPVDYVAQIGLFTAIIFVHNAFGATQDVAIDALAVNVLPEHERGVGQRLHVRRRVDRPGHRRLGRAVPHRGDAVQLDLHLRRGHDPARHDLRRAAAQGAAGPAAAATGKGAARGGRRAISRASCARRGARSRDRAPRSSASIVSLLPFGAYALSPRAAVEPRGRARARRQRGRATEPRLDRRVRVRVRRGRLAVRPLRPAQHARACSCSSRWCRRCGSRMRCSRPAGSCRSTSTRRTARCPTRRSSRRSGWR